jgi:hypothetical protein
MSGCGGFSEVRDTEMESRSPTIQQLYWDTGEVCLDLHNFYYTRIEWTHRPESWRKLIEIGRKVEDLLLQLDNCPLDTRVKKEYYNSLHKVLMACKQSLELAERSVQWGDPELMDGAKIWIKGARDTYISLSPPPPRT